MNEKDKKLFQKILNYDELSSMSKNKGSVSFFIVFILLAVFTFCLSMLVFGFENNWLNVAENRFFNGMFISLGIVVSIMLLVENITKIIKFYSLLKTSNFSSEESLEKAKSYRNELLTSLSDEKLVQFIKYTKTPDEKRLYNDELDKRIAKKIGLPSKFSKTDILLVLSEKEKIEASNMIEND